MKSKFQKLQNYRLATRLQLRETPLAYQMLERRLALDASGVMSDASIVINDWALIGSESQFDDLGRLVSETNEYDNMNDDDDVVDWRTHDVYGYDDNNNLVSYIREEDHDANGIWDTRQSDFSTFGEFGLEIATSESDFDADGIVDSRMISTYAYDSDGLLVSITYEIDENADGTIDSTTFEDIGDDATGGGGGNEDGETGEAAYDFSEELDDQGRVIRATETWDFEADGIADQQTITQYAYDDYGNIASVIVETDNGVDGIVDSTFSDFYAYDSEGALLSITHEVDENGDGIVDWSSVEDFTVQPGDDGYEYTEELDENGRVISAFESWDFDGDGIADQTISQNHSYDDAGNLLVSSFESDLDGDGQVDSISVNAMTYNESGWLITTENYRDDGGDAVIDYRSVATHHYSNDGSLWQIDGQIDEDGDGTFDTFYVAFVNSQFPSGGEFYAVNGTNDGNGSGDPTVGDENGIDSLANAVWQLSSNDIAQLGTAVSINRGLDLDAVDTEHETVAPQQISNTKPADRTGSIGRTTGSSRISRTANDTAEFEQAAATNFFDGLDLP